MTYTFYAQNKNGKRFAKTAEIKNRFNLHLAINSLEIEGYKVEVMADGAPYYETGKGFINQ